MGDRLVSVPQGPLLSQHMRTTPAGRFLILQFGNINEPNSAGEPLYIKEEHVETSSQNELVNIKEESMETSSDVKPVILKQESIEATPDVKLFYVKQELMEDSNVKSAVNYPKMENETYHGAMTKTRHDNNNPVTNVFLIQGIEPSNEAQTCSSSVGRNKHRRRFRRCNKKTSRKCRDLRLYLNFIRGSLSDLRKKIPRSNKNNRKYEDLRLYLNLKRGIVSDLRQKIPRIKPITGTSHSDCFRKLVSGSFDR